MFIVLLVTISVILAAWAYIYWLRVKSYWDKRGVPSSPPHPIFGNLTFLQQVNPAIWMRQIYDKYQAPYVGIWLFWRPALIINSPEIARNVLVKDAANFRDRLLSSAAHDPIGSLNIFTANDPLWTKVRRHLTPIFTSSKLKSVQHLMATKSKELVQRIAIENKKGKFKIKDIYNDFTSDIIGTASFGIKNDATLTGESPIRVITKDFEKYSLSRGIAWSCIFFFPELVGIFKFTLFPKSATDYFRKLFEIMVQQRKGDVKTNADARDLLDILLQIKQKSIEDNDELSDDLLLAQAAIFVQGGFDTAGSNLSFTTYELAHNPEVQEKLYIELKEEQEKRQTDALDENSLSQLTYLNCVIKETLRKYQPMGWLDRIAAKDYKIDDKLTIAAGTPIYVNAIGMHYDPKYFPEPLEYNPDRFLPENEANIQKFTFIPFGEGPRNCIGQRFALTTVRNAMSQVVLNYELRPIPNTPKPNDVKIEKNGLFLSPGEPLYVEFVPRK